MAYVESIEAKSTIDGQQRVVATGEITVYESVEEAVEGLGAERVLNYTNRQNKINELNRIRTAATQGTTIPKVLREKLMALEGDNRKIVADALGIDLDDLLKQAS